MPAERVENDVEAIYAAADRAVARARAGQGPTLLEVHTVRLWGHFEGDAQGYRPELADVPSMDPIPRYEQRLRDEGVLDDAVIARTRQEAQARVEQAIAFAKDSPVPDPATASSYVFS
jgi:pyruvate dehydrogenase E1 component alpha subunit